MATTRIKGVVSTRETHELRKAVAEEITAQDKPIKELLNETEQQYTAKSDAASSEQSEIDAVEGDQ